MLFNNVEVLIALTQSPSFFPDLFRRLHVARGGSSKAADADWVDHVSFLQARRSARHHPLPRRGVGLGCPCESPVRHAPARPVAATGPFE